MTDSFKFMQLNAWYGRLYYPLKTLLARERPDIFSVQEMWGGAKHLTPSFYTAEAIQEDFFAQTIRGGSLSWVQMHGQDFPQCCATFFTKDIACGEHHIIPVYHNLVPMTGVTPHSANAPATPNNILSDYYNLLHSVARLANGTVINILNLHNFLVIDGGMGNPIADANIQSVANYIKTLSGPILISGDFNLERQATSLQPLHDLGLVNLNDIYNIDVSRNLNAWKADAGVSHVFISKHFDVLDYHVAPDIVSDHAALVMTARVKT